MSLMKYTKKYFLIIIYYIEINELWLTTYHLNTGPVFKWLLSFKWTMKNWSSDKSGIQVDGIQMITLLHIYTEKV